jgi:hypothetical protein
MEGEYKRAIIAVLVEVRWWEDSPKPNFAGVVAGMAEGLPEEWFDPSTDEVWIERMWLKEEG